MNKLFDLEAFKAGQKALTRDGRVATFVGICEQCEIYSQLLALLEGNDQVMFFNLDGKFEHPIEEYNTNRYDLVSMVSRHQLLIDAWHNGASIEGRLTPYSEWVDLPHPSWHEDKEYRIKPEVTKPITKTVYEWLVKYHGNKFWEVLNEIHAEEDIKFLAKRLHFSYHKTGRSWEVEV